MLNYGWPIDGLNVGYLENGNTELSLGVFIPIDAFTGRLSLGHLEIFCAINSDMSNLTSPNGNEITRDMRLTDWYQLGSMGLVSRSEWQNSWRACDDG